MGRKSFGTFQTVIFMIVPPFLTEGNRNASAPFPTEEQNARSDEDGGFDECKQKAGEETGHEDPRTEADGGTADDTAKRQGMKHRAPPLHGDVGARAPWGRFASA